MIPYLSMEEGGGTMLLAIDSPAIFELALGLVWIELYDTIACRAQDLKGSDDFVSVPRF